MDLVVEDVCANLLVSSPRVGILAVEPSVGVLSHDGNDLKEHFWSSLNDACIPPVFPSFHGSVISGTFLEK